MSRPNFTSFLFLFYANLLLLLPGDKSTRQVMERHKCLLYCIEGDLSAQFTCRVDLSPGKKKKQTPSFPYRFTLTLAHFSKEGRATL